jgi:hypothetical protein
MVEGGNMSRKLGIALVTVVLAWGSTDSPAEAHHGVDVDVNVKDTFYFIVTADGKVVGRFPYDMSLTQFDPDAGWVEGDRVAYRCAYTFLVEDGAIVARVTFTRPPQASEYVRLNDKFMHEGERYYDGSWAGVPQIPEEECPTPGERYRKLKGRVGPRPLIIFSAADGHTLEIRDYSKIKRNRRTEFKIRSATPDRVTVVAYRDRRPVMVVYYDRLSDAITLTSNAPGV